MVDVPKENDRIDIIVSGEWWGVCHYNAFVQLAGVVKKKAHQKNAKSIVAYHFIGDQIVSRRGVLVSQEFGELTPARSR